MIMMKGKKVHLQQCCVTLCNKAIMGGENDIVSEVVMDIITNSTIFQLRMTTCMHFIKNRLILIC